MARKSTYSRRRRSSSRRVSSGQRRRGYSYGRGAGTVRRGRSTQRRGQTVRIVIEQPGSNPLARPDLLGLGIAKPVHRKPL